MKTEDRYLKFVRFSEQDQCYVGHCPDLFPWGGVCEGQTEEESFQKLCALVKEEVDELQAAGRELPVPNTRPMREIVLS